MQLCYFIAALSLVCAVNGFNLSVINNDGIPLRMFQVAGAQNKVRPVIFMHGIFNNADEPDFATQYIPKKVPGVKVYSINLWNGLKSSHNIDKQLTTIIPAMKAIMEKHRDTGVTLLCFSQGGVICRSVIQMMSTHNVHTFIALSSPLNGQYGETSYITGLIPMKDRKYFWRLLYNSEGQDLSIGNYWNDPHHQKEFSNPKLNILLARLNNQTGHRKSQEFKDNFMKLRKLVLIGGPDDGVITPWQSSQFGFYDENENVLPFEEQMWYTRDDFGLRTLHTTLKVVRHTHAGVKHTHWYRTAEVFDHYVIPYIN